MAEKGVVGDAEESISQRLSRKRESFYRDKESGGSSSSSVKKKKDDQDDKNLVRTLRSCILFVRSFTWVWIFHAIQHEMVQD